ncbi:glycosyltransferase family 2 protein [Altericista sp. CCNU0014]|uniref:glycosyltransferase family 2 protein n=1 Tax=Altericista sp. CCNU0014 TaxID=3082949 RepID=UPI00384B5CA4
MHGLSKEKKEKVYIIILNWNGWEDTIECLESIMKIDYDPYQIIVCDNESKDNSLDNIIKWAKGELDVNFIGDESLRDKVLPGFQKPVSYSIYSQTEALERKINSGSDSKLILIRNNGNIGFAAGNNVGINYALLNGDCDYVWLLNNDTIVDKYSLSELIQKIQLNPSAGMCGSTLLYYENPSIIQALGGDFYNSWTGFNQHIGGLKTYTKGNNYSFVKSQLSFLVGASILVRVSLLKEVGLLCEDYFLYYEELDWAVRAKKKSYTLEYASNSLVYHKVGASTGGSSFKMRQKSIISDFYLIRNRLLITHKFFPYALPTVYLSLAITLFRRLIRFQWNRIFMIARIIWTKGNCKFDYN